jgi:hypothetical protein
MSGPIFHRPSLADDAKPDPLGLARKVEKLYASCGTYRDAGKMNQEFRSVGTRDLEPEFDVELPVAALAFDPPEAKP